MHARRPMIIVKGRRCWHCSPTVRTEALYQRYLEVGTYAQVARDFGMSPTGVRHRLLTAGLVKGKRVKEEI